MRQIQDLENQLAQAVEAARIAIEKGGHYDIIKEAFETLYPGDGDQVVFGAFEIRTDHYGLRVFRTNTLLFWVAIDGDDSLKVQAYRPGRWISEFKDAVKKRTQEKQEEEEEEQLNYLRSQLEYFTPEPPAEADEYWDDMPF